MKKTGIMFLCLIVLLAGCATKSDKIGATYVSPLEYESYSCDQLKKELSRVSRRLTQISGQQDQLANGDAAVMAVGLILFWPALFAIDGDHHKSEIARLKGEYDAIERAGIENNCDKMKEDFARVDRQKKLYQEDKEKSKQVLDDLEKLFNLYKSGAISEEEYNSMKKKVLNLENL